MTFFTMILNWCAKYQALRTAIERRRRLCHHGFTTPTVCPVCQHFSKISEQESAAQKP